jgi:hypothetical protein
VRYSRSSDQTPVWVTAEALMALDGQPLPIAAVARHAVPTHHAAPTSHARSIRPAHRHQARHVHPRLALGRPLGPQRLTLTFVTDAGVAAALAFAPIGLG